MKQTLGQVIPHIIWIVAQHRRPRTSSIRRWAKASYKGLVKSAGDQVYLRTCTNAKSKIDVGTWYYWLNSMISSLNFLGTSTEGTQGTPWNTFPSLQTYSAHTYINIYKYMYIYTVYLYKIRDWINKNSDIVVTPWNPMPLVLGISSL